MSIKKIITVALSTSLLLGTTVYAKPDHANKGKKRV